MNDRDISDMERIIEITKLIGLGEAQRRIYETIEINNQLVDGLLEAYHHHEQGIDLLIKYQKSLTST